MAKLVKIAKTKKMLKVEIEGKEEWTNTSDKVYGFVKAKFKEGDEIDLQYSQKGGMKFVTRVTPLGSSSNSSSNSEPEFTCSECGAPLKDDKYDKCYTCNKKSKNSSGTTSSGKATSTNDSIVRQSVLRSAALAAQVVQGQVDANALGDYVLALYDKFLKKIK